jgi:hypothetical protein
MKQALEALEWNYGTDLENIENCTAWLDKLNATIPALRQAIAEAEQMVPSDYPNSHQQEPANPFTWEFESLGHAMLNEGKPFYRSGKKISLSAMKSGEKFILVRTGQVYSIKDNGSVWNETENRPSRLHKNCQVEPLYPAPVHASDISQKPVDETAKDRHELAGTIPISNGGIATSTPTDFFAPPKREWVWLSDKEVKKIVDKNTSDIWCNGKGVARDVEAKLKEKNG